MSNINFMERNASKNFSAPKPGSKEENIKKLTHLYMNEKYIQKIVRTLFIYLHIFLYY